MSTLKRTPLYDFHVAHGARIVPFAGWEMPVQYTGILEEHRAVRETAGLFDVSHMGEVTVKGARALEFLNFLVPNDVASIPDGKAIYSCMCQPDGGVVDDLIIYRNGPEDFFICINAGNIDKDVAWIVEQSKPFGVEVRNVSESYAQIAVQGPKAIDIVQTLTAVDCKAIKRFCFAKGDVAGVPCIISRTGYTGEDGVELYYPASQAAKLAEAVLAAGTPLGLKLAGLGCRDSLRLEAGYPLYGHEISATISPLQGSLGWTVKLGKKSDFIGRAALEKEKAAGPARQILHFVLDDKRIARQGTPVLDASGATVGEVVSGTHSPITGGPIGSALVCSKADRKALFVELRGARIPLLVKQAPLHKVS